MNAAQCLRLENLQPGCFSCVGEARTYGRRCRNPIAAGNILASQHLLNTRLDPRGDRSQLKQDLYELASRLLCRRNHQGQAGEVATKWYSILTDDVETQPPTTGTATAGRNNHDVTSSSVEEQRRLLIEQLCRMEERLRRLEEREREQHQADERRQAAERKRQEERRRQEERQQEERRQEEERLRAEREQAEREAESRRRAEREKARRERENATRTEREQPSQERREREQSDWTSSWSRYNRDWQNMSRIDTSVLDENIKDSVPWPVQSGLWHDVSECNVRQFFKHAPDGVADNRFRFRTLLRLQALRWHEDKLRHFFPRIAQDEQCLRLARLVMQVIIGLRER